MFEIQITFSQYHQTNTENEMPLVLGKHLAESLHGSYTSNTSQKSGCC